VPGSGTEVSRNTLIDGIEPANPRFAFVTVTSWSVPAPLALRPSNPDAVSVVVTPLSVPLVVTGASPLRGARLVDPARLWVHTGT